MKLPVLVLGATGIVGRGIIQAAVEAGWPVIAVARDAGELARLQAAHAGAPLTVLAGSVATDADSAELAERLRGLGQPLAGVVVAVAGGGARGRLLDHPTSTLCRQLDRDLLPHLAAARQLLPLLAEGHRGGTYVLIGGPGNELPWAGYGHRSVAAAALRMLACALHDEARALSIRVQLLSVDVPVCEDLSRAHLCPQWPSASAIGRRALALIERDDDGEPARAVVQYSASTHPRRDTAATGTAASNPVSVNAASINAATSEASAPPCMRPDVAAVGRVAAAPSPQFPDSDASLLPARCLQDARTLLRSLTSNHPPQDPSR